MYPATARLAICLFALATALPASARRVFPLDTTGLEARATIVCNGIVLSQENTLEKSSIYYPDIKSAPLSVETWKAKIKVLGISKGTLPDQIEVRFTQIDQHPVDDKTTIIADGPIEIRFMTGRRYRLFLKPSPGHPWYVGACDGDFDDGYAVQPLADIEPDDSPPPLSKDEVTKFATDYVKKIEPGVDISTIPPEASLWDGQWTVEFWSPPARPHETPATAKIEVLGNCQVGTTSWIADFCTSNAADLKPADIGRKFLICMNPYPKDKKFYNMQGPSAMVLLGTMKAVRDREIDLADVSQRDDDTIWPSIAVPIQDIQWIQRLNPAAVPAQAAAR